MKKIIGLDIGGTKITGIVWDGREVVKELTIVTPRTLFEFRHNLGKLVNFLRGRDKITQLGIGMAGSIDKKKKTVISSPNIRYIRNFSFVEVFKSHGFKKIYVDNDASCFLKAEIRLGQVKGYKHVVGLIFGTGVGGALYLNGNYYRGAENLGGEVGRIPMSPSSNWEEEYQKYRDRRDFKNLSRLVAKALYVLVKIFNPEAFVLSGSVALKEHAKYLPAAKKQLKALLAEKQNMPEIFISKINNAGAIGAATLTE
jgi:predicted NBD/HSP70 family sugar kinase